MFTESIFKQIHDAIPPEAFHNPAHDYAHSLRVAHNARKIAAVEGGDTQILIAAALLHDIGNVEKNHPQRHLSAEFSAQKASNILTSVNFPQEKIHIVLDAIRCHSFSRGLTPTTHEGKVFQDADRLDSIGAIGIARVFATGGHFGSSLYSVDDPFLKKDRTPDDKNYMIDHFFVKLYKLANMMQTTTGKKLAQARIETMKQFLKTLEKEIS
jgi:uncharacterized protein